jgi:hypothetical protein
VNVKICKGCKNALHLRLFRSDVRTKDGLSRFCDACNSTRDSAKSEHLTSRRMRELDEAGIRSTDSSVFGALIRHGHDLDFEPQNEALPTGARIGSIEQIEVLRLRVQNGQPLFHPGDEKRMATNEQRAECVRWLAAQVDVYRKWKNGKEKSA